MKEHTLEEASWKHNPLKKLDGEFLRHAFKQGAKWQQERSYSEGDMIIAMGFASSIDNNMEVDDKLKLCIDFIQQFKKK